MRIAQILISDSWGEVSPSTIEKGLGGRETAMLSLAREWAKQGHEVTNFVGVENSVRFSEKNNVVGYPGYHEYVPINIASSMLSNFPWDVCVAWECPSVFDNPKIRDNVRIKICEMQVAHFAKQQQEAAELYCDYIATLSTWHSEFLLHSGLQVEPERLVVLPNGIDPQRYINARFKSLSDTAGEESFVYSSSPDRGLWHLLNMWPEIRKVFPNATLSVGYGFTTLMDHLKWTHARQGEMAVDILELAKQPGVIDIGKIGQKELANLQMDATGYLYPCDPLAPTETGCITVVENAAAGNPMILSDADCLKTEFGDISAMVPLPFTVSDWMEAFEAVFTDPELYTDLSVTGRNFAQTRGWKEIAQQWTDLFVTATS